MTHYSNTPNPVDFPKLSTIDRLWGEALDRAVPDTYSTLTWTQVEKIKTVFAELIVLECANVALEQKKWVEDMKAHNPHDETWNQARIQQSQHIVEKIKQHFGVEE